MGRQAADGAEKPKGTDIYGGGDGDLRRLCGADGKHSDGRVFRRLRRVAEGVEPRVLVHRHRGGGYRININRYNNLSGNFTITIKEKIPIYFPIDDNYLVSKLSVFTVELEDSDIINVPLNFRNGIIFCVTKKNPNNHPSASIYRIHFGSDVYNDPPRPLCSLSDGKIIESGTSVLFPTCALIYVDGNRTCYLINPLQSASSTT